MGLAFATTGSERVLQGNEWDGVAAADWSLSFESGLNFKHADCDGNGVVNFEDLQALELNYNLTHGTIEPFEQEEGSIDDPALFVDLPDANAIQIGMPFTAPIQLGTFDVPIDDLYGIAFTLKFDPTIINPATTEIDYANSWLGQDGVNMLTFDYTDADEGEIDVVLTKIDQNNVSGYGQLAAFIGIIDNVAGKQEVEIEIIDVLGIMNNETVIPFQTPVEVVEITTNTIAQNPNNSISIFPNPTANALTVANAQQKVIEQISIKSIEGRLIEVFEGDITQLKISHLESGVYFLDIQIDGYHYVEKIIKL